MFIHTNRKVYKRTDTFIVGSAVLSPPSLLRFEWSKELVLACESTSYSESESMTIRLALFPSFTPYSHTMPAGS